MSKYFQTTGYEDLELSTQIVIKAALDRKIKVEVLDRKANFIKLKKSSRIEYIKEASKTSKNSYITSLIINNKHISKYILKTAGIHVPKGKHYENIKTALKDYSSFSWQKIVIKPNTTNFGIGIEILDPYHSKTAFNEAVSNAFKFDDTILIEEFIEGVEYRFLVIAGKTIGVIQRVPANIVGDGRNTIRELVKIKNNDPRRGEWCRAPLEYLQMSDIEKGILKKQKLSFGSIPKNGQQIFLRHNSNLSTGGDSIDHTDSVHPQYKLIAEKATKAVNAMVCGVDMMIINVGKAPTKNNYAVIEINDNPGLTMHNFPYKGKNRDTGKYILRLLNF